MVELIKTKNLDYSFGNIQVLKDINFNLEQSQIWAFIGPNGSGKSTFLRCLCGLLNPAKGQVLWQGKTLRQLSRKTIAQQVCFLPQTQIALQHIQVYELVSMGRSPYQNFGWGFSKVDKEKISWALDYMDLNEFKQRPVESLSGGEKQRVWIAMILAQDTPVVLLDEPTTFLDLKYQWDLLQKIRDIRNKLKKSFIVVFHDINQAIALADQVLVLKDGRVFQSGEPARVITADLLSRVYDIQADIYRISRNTFPVIVPKIQP
jgi:ABC-type cobalamin/Fe3+-siderophores transport system ATPase subunit